MRTAITHIAKSLLIAGFCVSAANEAHAGAWTQPKGKTQVITTALAYTTDRRFDNNGNRTGQPDYTKYELNPYVEHGLLDGTTIGASFFFNRLDDSARTNTGIGDTEVFVRQRVWQGERTSVVIQPMVKIPSPMSSDTRTPALGSRSADVGLSTIGGLSFDAFGNTHFAEAELGYRYRFGQPNDQILANATLGMRVTDEIIIMPQVFQTIRVDTNPAVGFTQSPRDDYTLTKVQLSGVYQFNEQNAVQLGVFNHVAGKNSGAGGGALLSYWTSF